MDKQPENTKDKTEADKSKKSVFKEMDFKKVIDMASSLAQTETGKKITKEGKEILTGVAAQVLTKKSLLGLKGALLTQAAQLALKHSDTVLVEGKKWINELTSDSADKTDIVQLVKLLTTDGYKNSSFANKVLGFLTLTYNEKDITKGKFNDWKSIIDSAKNLSDSGLSEKEILEVANKMVKTKISEEAGDLYAKHFKIKAEVIEKTVLKRKPAVKTSSKVVKAVKMKA